MKNVLVSIIVPIYAKEGYLAQCVESIRNQTHKNLQIILVDDESPDKCPEICDDYAKKDDRIIVIHKKNAGVSEARNAGLRVIKGEYVMFVDGDDELYPKAVELLLKDAFEYEADIVSANIKTIYTKQKINTPDLCTGEDFSVYRNNEALLLSLNSGKSTISACAKLFKSAFIKGCFFEKGKNINEDGFFVFECCIKKPVFVHHNMYVYQQNVIENSNSNRSFSDDFFSMLYFCERKKEIIEKHFPQYIEQARNMEIRTHLQFLHVLSRAKDKKYKKAHKDSVKIVRQLYRNHKPTNKTLRLIALLSICGLYPCYKMAIKFKRFINKLYS